MKRLKVMTVVGTRPEIIRLSCVIEELEKSSAIDHTLVHTGQNYDYELNQIFFDQLNIPEPNVFLNAVGDSALKTIGNVLSKMDNVLNENQPDALLVLGDTNSCFSAVAGKIKKIPVFHMEAGNRCFDLRVPEEINRRVVDHVSDINLCYSDIARDYLLREGLKPDHVIRTGSPMLEVLQRYKKEIDDSLILTKLKLEKQKYFLVSSHRAENVDSDKGIRKFICILKNLYSEYKLPVVVSTHPRTRKRLVTQNISIPKEISFLPPFGFFDYVHLQQNAKVTLSDSGTISEESSILKFPAINLRETHERPEAMEEASVIMTGYHWERIHQALSSLETLEVNHFGTVRDYSYSNVSKKIVRIIISYKDFIDRYTWKKEI